MDFGFEKELKYRGICIIIRPENLNRYEGVDVRTYSKLMEELKAEETLRYKNMSPEKRLEKAIAHNKFIKELCFAGLRKKGFSRSEINKIYNGQRNE